MKVKLLNLASLNAFSRVSFFTVFINEADLTSVDVVEVEDVSVVVEDDVLVDVDICLLACPQKIVDIFWCSLRSI